MNDGEKKLEIEISYDEETGLGFVTTDVPLKGRRIRMAVNGDNVQIEFLKDDKGGCPAP